MTSPLPERAGRRCHDVLNPLHSTHSFSPDLGREPAAVGVERLTGTAKGLLMRAFAAGAFPDGMIGKG